MFDPGGSKGRLRACPFLRTWRGRLCVRRLDETATFLEVGSLGHQPARKGQANRLYRMYSDSLLTLHSS